MKLYGSIGMSSRGSQEMIYQRKFKSLHRVKRSGKMKFEYLWREELEWNLKNSKGELKRGLGRSFCFQS
jgi:hypothetical protein